MANEITRTELLNGAGVGFGCSDWVQVDQPMIDAFADLTLDHQFIHVDPVAAAQTPFGGTIAHGMLTASLLSGLATGIVPDVSGMQACVNFGFDRIRFLAPVPAGGRIRGRYALRGAQLRGRDAVMARVDAQIEIEGSARPAMTADWLLLYTF